MKQLLLAGSLLLLLACRKDSLTVTNVPGLQPYAMVQSALRDSLSASDVQRLDWTKVMTFRIPGSEHYLLRVGFRDQPIAADFVLAEMKKNGRLVKGKLVHLEMDAKTASGELELQSLDRQAWQRRPLHKGKIKPRIVDISNPQQVTFSFPASDGGEWLPEVIVVGYRNEKPATYYYYLSFLDAGIGGSETGYYGGSEPSYTSEGGGGTGSSEGGSGSSSTGGSTNPFDPQQPLEPFLEVEAEYTDALPSVDIRKYFNCFDQVPNAGAQYSIQLCADIPINSNAEAAARLLPSMSPGHVFLVVTKTNGDQSVKQSFGFYPQQSPSFWDPYAGVQSSIKDNGVSEINASLSMNISEAQFNIIKQKSIEGANNEYRLSDYNCTDYALSIINAVRPTPLYVGPFWAEINAFPGAILNPITFIIKKAPQTLFMTLQTMKQQNSSESGQIQIDASHKLRAPISHGECN